MLGLGWVVANYYVNSWSVFAAGAVLGSLLPISLYVLLQDKIVGGLTAGSVKG